MNESNTASQSTKGSPKSEILIGHGDYGTNQGVPMRIELEAIPRHVAAFGTTGSGKTVVLKVCAESLLARGIPVVALDVMGDLTGLAIPAGSPDVYRRFQLPDPIEVGPEGWAMGKEVADRLEKKIYARYLTPCSDIGERLAISPLPIKPRYFDEEYLRDRDEMELEASSLAWALMGKVGLRQPRDGIGGEPELVRGLIFQAIIKAWTENIPMDGPEGIGAFLAIAEPIFTDHMPPSQHHKFINGLRSLATGQAARWLEGARLDWDDLLTVPDGRTPLIIIALKHLPLEQHPWVVSQVVSSLAGWCSNQPPTPGRPRIGLLIDELAGEGGKNSLLPHLTYSSASGSAIRHVLRKGRHWGLGLLAGTQSPSDIDGKSLTFFNTIFAGRLKTSHDVHLALSGGSMSEDRLKKIAKIVKSSSAPRMFYTTPSGWCDSIRVRWLGSLHSRIEKHQIAALYESGHFKRPDVKLAGPRWAYRDAHLHDNNGRMVAILSRMGQSIVTAVIDSAGAGLHTGQFPWTDEGLMRAALWVASKGAAHGVTLVCRTVEDRQELLALASRARVPLPGQEHTWYTLPRIQGKEARDLVVAVHSAVRTQGSLLPLISQASAA